MNIIGLFIVIPLAYLSTKIGKKLIGQTGNFLQAVGLAVIFFASLFSNQSMALLAIGVIIFSIGTSLFRSTWFALLASLLNNQNRAFFFASLRTSWKVFSLLFGFFMQFLLYSYEATVLTQLICLLILTSLIQMFFYQWIPDHDVPNSDKLTFYGLKTEVLEVIHDSAFSKLLKFKFSVPLFTGSLALLFNLYEKKYLNFQADEIVLMGNLMFVGNLVGFWLGVALIKKYNEGKILKLMSICVMAISLLFILSLTLNDYLFLYIGLLTFVFGCTMAIIGMAETHVMLSKISNKNKEIASSLWIAISQFGFVCSGLLSAYVVKQEWGMTSGSVLVNEYTFLLVLFTLPFPIVAYHILKDLTSEELKPL